MMHLGYAQGKDALQGIFAGSPMNIKLAEV